LRYEHHDVLKRAGGMAMTMMIGGIIAPG